MNLHNSVESTQVNSVGTSVESNLSEYTRVEPSQVKKLSSVESLHVSGHAKLAVSSLRP